MTATAPSLSTAPAWAKEILRRQERIEQQLKRLAQPVDLLTAAQVAKRLGISERAAKEKLLRIFTDTRDTFDRGRGRERRAFSDEVEIYIRGGLKDLRDFQQQTGRRR